MPRNARNVVAVVLLLLSFMALVPGLREPLITISASFSVLGRTMEIFRDTRSILQTIRSLHESGNDFVAGLILLFGVVVPVVKGGMLLIAFFLRSDAVRGRIDRFVRAISKWAMNDVFLVAVYVSFLSAKATDALDAEIEPGFYWFTAYCLLSLLSLQFLQLTKPPEPEGTRSPPSQGP